MHFRKKRDIFMLVFSSIVLFLILLLQPLEVIGFREHIAVLFPKGIIALEQRNLLFIIQLLMLLVIIPVYVLTFIFSWKYRISNPKAKYDPEMVDSSLAEMIWWGVPLIMTAIISVLTWVKTYELDPYKPIPSDKPPLVIQAVALNWKWLFIYPEEKIAAVNFVQIPVDRPIHFLITADAPMNSLWIPHLAGQIYAMPGMRTELFLIANETGDFRGSSANLSGEGFSGMHFITRASSKEDYEKWVSSVKSSKESLENVSYQDLKAPSKNNPVTLYRLEEGALFDEILHSYMHPKKEEM